MPRTKRLEALGHTATPEKETSRNGQMHHWYVIVRGTPN